MTMNNTEQIETNDIIEKNTEQIETNDIIERITQDEKLLSSFNYGNEYVVKEALVAIRLVPNINGGVVETVRRGMKLETYTNEKIPEPWLGVSAVDGRVVKGYINSTYLSKE